MLIAGAMVVLIDVLRTLNIGWAGRGPGDGFFHFWLVLGVLLSSVIVLIQSLRKVPHSNSAVKPFV